LAAWRERTGYTLGELHNARTLSTRAGPNFVIEVDHLSVSYYLPYETANCALHDISFRISAGEGVGVLGESGAGKSTLALALMGLLPRNARVTGESILLGGRNILDLDEDELQNVRGAQMALISQEPAAALNPVMRVGDQISEVLRAHCRWDPKRRRQAVEEMLRKVQLPEARQVSSCYPHELSGGEQQRVAIGQALICQPALLVADEPGSALDTARRAEVFACLKEAKTRLNMAILMITHDPATLVGLAGRLLVLHKGELVDETTLVQVLQRPTYFSTAPVFPSVTTKPLSSAAASLDKFAIEPQESSGQSPEALATGHTRISGCDTGHHALLVAKQLHKRYEKRRWATGSLTHAVEALTGASLVLRAGRTTCLVGESGSGKSTLAKCLAVLESPDSGEVCFNGCDLLRLSSAELRRRRRTIQLVMQDAAAAFNPSLTIEETVAEPLRFIKLPRASRRDRTVALMEKVGLPEPWRRRKPQDLSGGQRQRLAMARALAADPTVLIFDEALNGLDLPVQAEMIELLRELREASSLAYLFITHNLDLTRHLADEIAVMHAGKIVQCSSPTDVLQCPRDTPAPPYSNFLTAGTP
jgi:peptide/nickel transport system ATP-binding protein